MNAIGLIESLKDLADLNYVASARKKDIASYFTDDLKMEYFYSDCSLDFLLKNAVSFKEYLELQGLSEGHLYSDVIDLIQKLRDYGFSF